MSKRTTTGRNPGTKQQGMGQLALAGVLILLLVSVIVAMIFTRESRRILQPTQTTQVRVAKWTVFDPQGKVVDSGTLPADVMPNSGNACYGMPSSSYHCTVEGGQMSGLVLAMVTLPQARPEKETFTLAMQAPHTIDVDCSNGTTTHAFVDLKGVGPKAAEVLSVGFIPVGEWRYLDITVCGQPHMRFGWVHYPDPGKGLPKVVYHLWQEPEWIP